VNRGRQFVYYYHDSPNPDEVSDPFSGVTIPKKFEIIVRRGKKYEGSASSLELEMREQMERSWARPTSAVDRKHIMEWKAAGSKLATDRGESWSVLWDGAREALQCMS
jgi:hypothetical protein